MAEESQDTGSDRTAAVQGVGVIDVLRQEPGGLGVDRVQSGGQYFQYLTAPLPEGRGAPSLLGCCGDSWLTLPVAPAGRQVFRDQRHPGSGPPGPASRARCSCPAGTRSRTRRRCRCVRTAGGGAWLSHRSSRSPSWCAPGSRERDGLDDTYPTPSGVFMGRHQLFQWVTCAAGSRLAGRKSVPLV
jgi:hypothetical protein